MTIYGNTSRVSVDVTGGTISAVGGATEQKVVVFARGDPSSGSAQVNDPTQVSGPGGLDSTFGSGTDIVEQMTNVNANGVDFDMIWGVMPSTTAVTAEAVTGGSGTLGNAPIIEDAAEITVTNTTASQEETPVFKYGSPPSTSGLANDEVAINPNTGEFEAGDTDDYEVDYKYLDWQSAFDSATGVVEEQEVGHWSVKSEAESVIDSAKTTVEPLRQNEWKMITVGGLVQPNDTASDGVPSIDPAAYSDNLDSDALFITGPTRANSESVVGCVSGVMGGNALTDPIIGEDLDGIDSLDQTLTVPEQEDLEGENVIPLSNSGDVTIEGNLSTSTASDWLRTYFSRRIADYMLLAARAIAKTARGQLNSDNTESIVEQRLNDEIFELIDDNVLKSNTEAEQRWYVNVDQDDSNQRELEIDFGFTPTGVVDIVTVEQTINY